MVEERRVGGTRQGSKLRGGRQSQGDLSHVEPVARSDGVLLKEGEQPSVLLRLLRYSEDRDLSALGGIGEADPLRPVRSVAVAGNGIPVRARGWATQKLVDAVGDSLRQGALEMVGLLVGLRPAESDHLGEK